MSVPGGRFPLPYKGTLFYVEANVHASMRSAVYKVQVWCDEKGILASRCTCKAGMVICHHALGPIIQLETACMSRSGSLTSVLTDSFTVRLGTSPFLAALRNESVLGGSEKCSVWETLRRLLQFDKNGEAIDDDRMLFLLTPGTENRKSLRRSFQLKSVTHLQVKDVKFNSPAALAKRDRGVTADKIPAGLFCQYDPFCGLHDNDLIHIDYRYLLERHMQASKATGGRYPTHVCDTVFHALCKLRARTAEDRRVPSTTESSVSLEAPSREGRKRKRGEEGSDGGRNICAFVNCKCRKSDHDSKANKKCPFGCHGWRSVPRLSVARSALIRDRRNATRQKFLRCMGLPRSTTGYLLCCPCHFQGRKRNSLPSSEGVSRISVSGVRQSVGVGRFHVVRRTTTDDMTIESLLDSMEERTDELSLSVLEERTTAERAHTLLRQGRGVRFVDIKTDPARCYAETKFANGEHVEMFIDFLCNGNRAALQKVRYFRYKKIKEGVYNNEIAYSGGRGRNGKELSVVDEIYFYLFVECTTDSFADACSKFRISEITGRETFYTWAMVINKRFEAFGLFPSYEEHMVLTPGDWKTKYGNRRCILWDTTGNTKRNLCRIMS